MSTDGPSLPRKRDLAAEEADYEWGSFKLTCIKKRKAFFVDEKVPSA